MHPGEAPGHLPPDALAGGVAVGQPLVDALHPLRAHRLVRLDPRLQPRLALRQLVPPDIGPARRRFRHRTLPLPPAIGGGRAFVIETVLPMKPLHAFGRMFGHAAWLPFGVRDRALRLLFPPHQRLDVAFEVDLGRARFAGNLDNYIDWHVYFFGRYEAGLLAFIEAALRQLGPAPSFWDVGANCGQHAVFAAGCGATVEAFEPYPPVRRRLAANVALNPDLSVRIHPFGLGDTDADLLFREPSGENLGTGAFATDGTLILPVRRADGLGLPPPDLVKIDVEGFEGAVLRGMARTLAAARPLVLCEYSQRTRKRDGDLRRLLPENYRVHIIAGAERPRLLPYTGAATGETLLFLPDEKWDASELDG